jgi:CRISPR-associated protein Csh1
LIEAVRRIGDYVQGINDGEDSLYKIIENPDSNGKYKHVLVVALNEIDGNYSFRHVELQELKDYKIYLYKGKKGNSTDATPTSRITEMEKTFKNKFLRWFENYEEYPLSGEEKEALKKMCMVISAEREKILAELNEKFSGKKPGESGIITLGIEDDGNIKYLIDIPLFRNVLLMKGNKAFSNKYNVESIGKDAMCSICREVKPEVYGFAIPWTFHTFNKRGFVAGGFNVADAWKNTPVCYDCATRLEIGKKYVEENLDFEFSTGIRYMLIPKLALGGDFREILSILGAKQQKRKQKLNHEVGSHITASDEEILDIVEEQSDLVPRYFEWV